MSARAGEVDELMTHSIYLGSLPSFFNPGVEVREEGGESYGYIFHHKSYLYGR